MVLNARLWLRSAADWLYRRPIGVFLGLALVFGVASVFSVAPLNGTDEFTHFPRVYQISQGTLWERPIGTDQTDGTQFGGPLPDRIAAMVDDYRDLSRKSDYRQYEQRKHELARQYGSERSPGTRSQVENFTSVVVYPPWAYAPSVLGVVLARAVHAPLAWYVYLARLSTLLVWIALTCVALRLLPRGKWFLLAVALLPTSLTQAATVGADGLLNGLSWLLIAAVLAVWSRPKRWKWPLMSIIAAASVGVSVIKLAYWPLAVFPLLLPVSSFAGRRTMIAAKAGLITLIGAAGGWFAWHSTHIGTNTVLTPREGQYINSHAQLHYVLGHPLLFVVRALTQPFSKDYDAVYQGIVGVLTSRTVYLSILVMALLYAVLLAALASTRPLARLRAGHRRLRWGAAGIIVATQLLLSATFYLANTQVGAVSIFGVYGRYFLPLLPLLLVWPLTMRTRLIGTPSRVGLGGTVIIIVALLDAVRSIG